MELVQHITPDLPVRSDIELFSNVYLNESQAIDINDIDSDHVVQI